MIIEGHSGPPGSIRDTLEVGDAPAFFLEPRSGSDVKYYPGSRVITQRACFVPLDHMVPAVVRLSQPQISTNQSDHMSRTMDVRFNLRTMCPRFFICVDFLRYFLHFWLLESKKKVDSHRHK